MKKILNFLGSRNLSVFIFMAGVTYFLMLAVFGAIIPTWWVNNLSKLLPFKVLYIFFFINLIICLIKWIPVVSRRLKKIDMPTNEEDFKRFRHRKDVASDGEGLRKLESFLKWRGYKIERSLDRIESTIKTVPEGYKLFAYRGRYSALGNLIFHFSFFFILVGVFLAILYRFEGKVLLMEGQGFNGSAAEYGGVSKAPFAVFPDVKFEVLDIKPEFWGERLLFTDLAANLNVNDYIETARLSSAVRMNGANITLTGISYTPKYELRKLKGGAIDVGYVNLINFVPGSSDYFKIPEFPYKIYVSIYPDVSYDKSNLETKSMNLINPILFVRVVRNKVPLFSGVLGFDDEAFFDGFGLKFTEIKYNGNFQIVKNPGNWFIWAGLAMMGIGLAWKLLFFRREIYVSFSKEKAELSVYSDYHANLLLNKCNDVLNN